MPTGNERRAIRAAAKGWDDAVQKREREVQRDVLARQIEAQQEFDRLVVQPLLKRIAGELATFTPRGNDLVPEAFPQIAALQREIQALIERGSANVRAFAQSLQRELAKAEAAWTADALGVPSAASQAVMTNAANAAVARPWLGDSTERWFGKMLERPTADAVRAWINTGIQRGLSTDEIVRGLRGTKTQSGILTDRPKYQVAALVRTAATHAATAGRHESFRALGITRYRFVATLDGSTSKVCQQNDGREFELGKGPVPPLHPNCRSVTAPVVEGGLEGDRASIDGPVAASTTYGELAGRVPGTTGNHREPPGTTQEPRPRARQRAQFS